MEQRPHQPEGDDHGVNSYGTDDPEQKARIEQARAEAAEQRRRDRARLERYVEAGLNPDDAEAVVEFEHFVREQRAQTDQDTEQLARFGLNVPTDPELVERLTRGIAEYGPAYAAFVTIVGTDDHDMLDRFNDFYVGSYDSPDAWAKAVGEDLEWDAHLDRVVDPMLRPYVRIDYAKFAQEQRYAWDVVQGSDGKTHVFMR